MTPQEQYKIDLDKWAVDIAAWQKAQKAWVQSIVSLSKNPPPKPDPAPRPPTPCTVDWSNLKNLLGSGNQPSKPVNPPPPDMSRPI